MQNLCEKSPIIKAKIIFIFYIRLHYVVSDLEDCGQFELIINYRKYIVYQTKVVLKSHFTTTLF